jgi:hypothetical protein
MWQMAKKEQDWLMKPNTDFQRNKSLTQFHMFASTTIQSHVLCADMLLSGGSVFDYEWPSIPVNT